MLPEKFNKMENTPAAELKVFMDTLLRDTATALKKSRGDAEATKAALWRYYQKGLEVKLTPEELEDNLYHLLLKVRYTPDQRLRVLSLVNGLHAINFGAAMAQARPADHEATPAAPRTSDASESNADMQAGLEVAKQFGDFIAKRDYAAAHALLTSEARRLHSPNELKQAVKTMTAYAPGPIRQVKAMEDLVLADWPDKQDGDLAWVYVSLSGDDYAEAVSLVLTKQSEGVRVRHLEWGRP